MEFTYEIDKDKAMIVAKEQVIYGFKFRKKFASWYFSFALFIACIGILISIIPAIRIVNLTISLFVALISIALIFKGKKLEILAVKKQSLKLYKKKSKLQRNVILDENQITITYEGKKSKSFSLNSINHITYRSDLGGIFFSKSKLARFVFFVDLSNLEEESKVEVFKILLDNLTDKDAQQELKNSLPQNH
jgi:hypothetical protein